MDEVEEAQKVLLKESKSIKKAATRLNNQFSVALDILNETKEKISKINGAQQRYDV